MKLAKSLAVMIACALNGPAMADNQMSSVLQITSGEFQLSQNTFDYRRRDNRYDDADNDDYDERPNSRSGAGDNRDTYRDDYSRRRYRSDDASNQDIYDGSRRGTRRGYRDDDEGYDYDQPKQRNRAPKIRNYDLWVRGYGLKTGGWKTEKNPRYLADVNGDGKADVVGFSNDGVYVSLARREKFTKPKLWVKAYGVNTGGWQLRQNRRYMGDVNGDGKADIIGFSNDGVYVSLARPGRFTEPALWVRGYGVNNGGWNDKITPRTIADVNGDGRMDIVGFSTGGVYVSLAKRRRFTKPRLWIAQYGLNTGGWNATTPRVMADVNGDGKADVVGFSTSGVFVSLARNGKFGKERIWVNGFTTNAGGWDANKHPRVMADVNGDGRADIVGFGNAGVFVSLARNGRFSEPELWVRGYGAKTGGWKIQQNPRFVSDMNGDGRADIVGISNDGVYVSIARRDGGFTKPRLWVKAFGVNTGGWSRKSSPRMIADVDGDGRSDIVGFASGGVFVSRGGR